MVGLIVIYFIAKAYYDLAAARKKNAWAFAVVGVALYYLGAFAGGIVIGIAAVAIQWDIENISSLVMGLISFPFGLLAQWVVHIMLRNAWSTEVPPPDDYTATGTAADATTVPESDDRT